LENIIENGEKESNEKKEDTDASRHETDDE